MWVYLFTFTNFMDEMDDVQGIEQLSFIFMQTFSVKIKDTIGIELDMQVFFAKQAKTFC